MNNDAYGVDFDSFSNSDLTKEVSHYLSQLSTATSNKMSLIKMQVIKVDENDNNYKRMRSCFNHGDIEEADRILAMLEESNHQALLDLQNEISDGPNASQIIGYLAEQLKKEKMETSSNAPRGRSPGLGNLRNRSASANRGPVNIDISKYDA